MRRIRISKIILKWNSEGRRRKGKPREQWIVGGMDE
jgi:hypothetical protein